MRRWATGRSARRLHLNPFSAGMGCNVRLLCHTRALPFTFQSLLSRNEMQCEERAEQIDILGFQSLLSRDEMQ